MTAVDAPARAAAPTRFVDVVRMEWIKVRSVPSTFLALLVTLTVGIGLSALVSGLVAGEYADNSTPGIRDNWDPTSISIAGGGMAQIALAVLGALAITSEYSTGEIRSSLVAVPQRLRLLLAKAVVVGLIAFATALVVMFTAFFIGQALISGKAPTASIDQPGVLRALIGGGLYVVLLALLALATGTILRGTASTITLLVMVVYVLPPIFGLLPDSWRDPIQKYWPTQAGAQIASVVHQPNTLGPWTGYAVMLAFTAIVLAAAGARLARSDA